MNSTWNCSGQFCFDGSLKLHSLRVGHKKSAIVELLALSLAPVQLELSHMDIENMNIELELK